MPRVTVEVAGFLKRVFDAPVSEADPARSQCVPVVVPDGTTVDGLIRRLGQLYPAFGDVIGHEASLPDAVQIVLCDRLLELAGGRGRVLSDGDTVLLLPPFEGG